MTKYAFNAYFKDRSAWKAWQQLSQAGRLPELGAICVQADICRPELLFELEVMGGVGLSVPGRSPHG